MLNLPKASHEPGNGSLHHLAQPAPWYHARSEPCTIGLDIGGAHMSGGFLDHAGMLLATCSHPSQPRTYDELLDAIERLHDRVCAIGSPHGLQAAAVGVALAGFLTRDRRRIIEALNLHVRDRSVADDLSERLRQPVAVHNDGDAAAWGEFLHGGGQGADCLLVVTVGTGVGAGIVHRGELLTGGSGLAGEIGHLCIENSGRACPCGNLGCLEQYASGPALARSAKRRASSAPNRAATLLALAGGAPEWIDGSTVTAAAKASDPIALEAFAEVGQHLGYGLALAATTLDPSLILLGGGVASAGELLLAPARAAFQRTIGVPGSRQPIEIHLAANGNRAGCIGAAALARELIEPRSPDA